MYSTPCVQESVDFFQNGVQRTLAVVIPEIVFRAKRAVIRAAARRFHLSAGPCRLGIEPMMMMLVPSQPVHPASAAPEDVFMSAARFGPRTTILLAFDGRQWKKRFERSPLVEAEFLRIRPKQQHRRSSFFSVARGVVEPCGPTMTSLPAKRPQIAAQLLRNSQFRRRASPEQITGRSRNRDDIGRELPYALDDF